MEDPTLDVPAVSDAARQAMPGTGLIIVDPDLRIVHADGAVMDQPGDEAMDWPGRFMSDVLAADLMRILEPHYRAALAGERQSFDYWSPTELSAGEPLNGERVPASAHPEDRRAVTGAIERMQISEELSLSEARLQESERMVGVGSWELILETAVITSAPVARSHIVATRTCSRMPTT